MTKPRRDKLAINQATTMEQWSLRAAIEGYAAHQIKGISIWRDKLADCGLKDAITLLKEYDMSVTGLCRGGMFTATTQQRRDLAIDENKRALDEAAAINANCLIMVCGGLPQNYEQHHR